MITIRCFESLASASHLRAEVNALNLMSARPDPFSTFEFYENYLEHNSLHPRGTGMSLWFLAAFTDGRLVGYVALRKAARRVLWSRVPALGFLVSHDADRPHVVATPAMLAQVSAAFCTYLFSRRAAWEVLEFQQQDATSSLYPLPAAVDRSGHLVRDWPGLENCTIHLRWSSLQGYLDSLSQRFRSNVTRQLRGLLGAGAVELLVSSDPAVTPALFVLYRGIEAHSWKSHAGADIGHDPERIAYFEGLLAPGQPMRVSIHLLLLDGQPVAGLIAGAFGDALHALHMVYDARLSRHAPGSAMLLVGVRAAIDQGCATFNLLSGFAYYKKRWLATVTPTRIAQVYRAGTLAFWVRVLGDFKRRLLAKRKREAGLHFNPQRRAVLDRMEAPTQADADPLRATGPEERQRTDALVGAARRAGCLVVPAALLAADLAVARQPSAKGRNRPRERVVADLRLAQRLVEPAIAHRRRRIGAVDEQVARWPRARCWPRRAT